LVAGRTDQALSQERPERRGQDHDHQRAADELGARTVAFPAVSAGIYGWPHEDAARIALTTVSQTPTRVEEARFVLFSAGMHGTFERVLAALPPGGHPAG